MGLYLASLVQLFAIQGLNQEKAPEDPTSVIARQVDLNAPRGSILDRNGHVLAEDRAVYDLTIGYTLKHRGLYANLEKEKLTLEEVHEAVSFLAEAARMPFGEMYEALMVNNSSVQVLRKNLGPAEERRIRAAMSRVPGSGLVLKPRFERVYPNGTALSHVIGLPKAVPDFAFKETKELTPGSGMERGLQERLLGREGQRKTMGVSRDFGVNPALDMQAAVPGENVLTTFDVGLSAFARQELAVMMESKPMTNCMAIVVDVKSGDLLAAIGLPDYNPNDPVLTLTDTVNPMSGKAEKVGWVFPAKWYVEPGSTFKPIMAAYALDQGAIGANTEFSNFNSRYKVPGRKEIIHNVMVPEVPMTFREAIIHSSNIVFAQIARAVDREAMANMLDALQYHAEPFFIEGLSTQFYPRQQQEREAFFKKRSPDGRAYTIPTMGYGHGFQVNPIDHAMVLAAIANGGELMAPRLLLDYPVISKGQIFSAESTALVREAMHAQASYRGRDQYLKHRDLMDICSKSGTAQIDYGPDKGKYYSLFTAYGPYENPEVLVLVIATGTEAIPGTGDGHFGIRVCGEAADAILYRALLERGLAQEEEPPEGEWIDASAPLDDRPVEDRLGVGNR
jgi:cell division protein FtsI/penicillin-binding protein 2